MAADGIGGDIVCQGDLGPSMMAWVNERIMKRTARRKRKGKESWRDGKPGMAWDGQPGHGCGRRRLVGGGGPDGA